MWPLLNITTVDPYLCKVKIFGRNDSIVHLHASQRRRQFVFTVAVLIVVVIVDFAVCREGYQRTAGLVRQFERLEAGFQRLHDEIQKWRVRGYIYNYKYRYELRIETILNPKR